MQNSSKSSISKMKKVNCKIIQVLFQGRSETVQAAAHKYFSQRKEFTGALLLTKTGTRTASQNMLVPLYVGLFHAALARSKMSIPAGRGSAGCMGLHTPGKPATACPVLAAAQLSFCLCTEATRAESMLGGAGGGGAVMLLAQLVFFSPKSMWLLSPKQRKTFCWPVKSGD